MNLSFENKVALVTGAASGMGLVTAKAFAEAGAAVALSDVQENAVRSAAEELVAAGHKAIGIRCNVADEAEVAAMVAQTVSTFGRLDAAFNNAGIQSPAVETADARGEEFDRHFGTGPWLFLSECSSRFGNSALEPASPRCGRNGRRHRPAVRAIHLPGAARPLPNSSTAAFHDTIARPIRPDHPAERIRSRRWRLAYTSEPQLCLYPPGPHQAAEVHRERRLLRNAGVQPCHRFRHCHRMRKYRRNS